MKREGHSDSKTERKMDWVEDIKTEPRNTERRGGQFQFTYGREENSSSRFY